MLQENLYADSQKKKKKKENLYAYLFLKIIIFYKSTIMQFLAHIFFLGDLK